MELKQEEEVEERPLSGVRRVIAERMTASLRESAQITLHTSVEAVSLLAYRKKLKTSPEEYGLRDVTINDLLLSLTAKALSGFRELNGHLVGETVRLFREVHLAFAVDTPKGLMAPVIRRASELGIRSLSQIVQMLRKRCQEGTISPDELAGGTFTVSNLGTLGIESFTPILNPPQIALLGIGNVVLRPVRRDGEVVFLDHINLSLTVNHQVVDGTPAGRFLKTLSEAIVHVEIALAL
jgi:pyruvate dehydrogenase E2 component (dihydrolipoamide acetyltransferase)